jgi:hypothetical protein
VPTASDDAVINVPAITVTHNAGNNDAVHSLTSQDAISFSNGSRSIAATSSIISTLTFSAARCRALGR